MKSYCVKERRQTECVPRSERLVTIKNGRKMMKCKCAECGITKTTFISGQKGRGELLKTGDDLATEAFVRYGVPYMA